MGFQWGKGEGGLRTCGAVPPSSRLEASEQGLTGFTGAQQTANIAGAFTSGHAVVDRFFHGL